MLSRAKKGALMGCAGVEVDVISKSEGRGNGRGGGGGGGQRGPGMSKLKAPLMSNLAVGRDYRRRGVAEDLVREAEDLARKVRFSTYR